MFSRDLPWLVVNALVIRPYSSLIYAIKMIDHLGLLTFKISYIGRAYTRIRIITLLCLAFLDKGYIYIVRYRIRCSE